MVDAEETMGRRGLVHWEFFFVALESLLHFFDTRLE